MGTEARMPEAPPAPLSRPVTFATAGLGGVIGWVIVHPFNTLAVRMNLQRLGSPTGHTERSFYRYSVKVIQEEGFISLYSGLSAGIARQVFYATSRFGLFEVFRDQMAKYRETDFLSRLVVGVASGACAAFISCPAEVSLVRMSNDKTLPLDKRRNYKSVFDAGLKIARTEGVKTFWRGSIPFVNRAMVVGATQVGTYDQFKQMFSNALGVPTTSLTSVFLSSMSAGLVYSVLTMPLEAVKNRMAFQTPVDGKLIYTSTTQSLRHVIANEGFWSLYSGFFPYYGRCGGHTVTMFIAVEQLRKWYRSYTSN